MTTRFLLIRHGLTDAVGHRLSGHAPGVHLNSAGRAQVAQLVERLHDVPLTAVVSSPLERTRETADPIALDHGLKVVVCDALIEFDVAGWTGTSLAELDASPRFQRFNNARSLTRAERGELMLDVQTRAVTALLDLRTQDPSGTVAIVTHGDVIRSILLFALGMPIDFYHRIEISPARVTLLELDDDRPRVLVMNADSLAGGL